MKSNRLFSVIFIGMSLLQSLAFHAQVQPQNSIGLEHTVAVIPFSTAFEQNEEDADYSKMLTAIILTSITQSQRFIMVDVADVEQAVQIIKRQEQNPQDFEGWDSISDRHLVEAGKKLGIEYIFTGSITNVSYGITEMGLYRAEFGFTLKALSVESNRIYVTETFAVNSDKGIVGRFGGKDSKKEALNAALININEPLQKFIDKNFPIEARFYKINESDKKGVPKVIIISAGLSNGLREEQEMDIIVKEIDTNGSLYRNKIGEIKIVDMDSDYSICKVLKGGENILKALSENKDNLYARSKASKY